MATPLRAFLALACAFATDYALAGHGDADTGFLSNQQISEVRSVNGGTNGWSNERNCPVFEHPGLDVVTWGQRCESPRVEPPAIPMCRVFAQPGLDVALWTVPCDTLASGRRP